MRFLVLVAALACSTSKSAESDVHLEATADSKATDIEHREISGQQETVKWTVQQPTEVIEETFTPDGGLARRVTRKVGIKETSTGIDRSFVASADGTSGLETHTEAKAEAQAQSASQMHPASGCAFGAGILVPFVVLGLAALVWFNRKRFLP